MRRSQAVARRREIVFSFALLSRWPGLLRAVGSLLLCGRGPVLARRRWRLLFACAGERLAACRRTRQSDHRLFSGFDFASLPGARRRQTLAPLEVAQGLAPVLLVIAVDPPGPANRLAVVPLNRQRLFVLNACRGRLRWIPCALPLERLRVIQVRLARSGLDGRQRAERLLRGRVI